MDEFKGFVVTGRLYNSNKRFSRHFGAGLENAKHAFGINLWNGAVYGIKHDGKRKLLKRVTN